MNNKAIFGALAIDLKRVALGYHRGSNAMAERFLDEAIKRRSELEIAEIKPYLSKFLKNIDNLKKESGQKGAEDALMYSTIFQNASQKII
jgi:hypothetical protein